MKGFEVLVDEPASVGGTDLGPEPTSLLLASVASCFTIAIAYCARKQNVELNALSVSVTGKYDGPRFGSIRIDSKLDCDPEKVDTIVSAAERVCYVTNTLKSGPEINIHSSGITTGAT